jgi:hypothetical protein
MYTHDLHAAKPYVRDLYPSESQKPQIVSLTWKEFLEKLSELDMKRNEEKQKRRSWKHVFAVSG